MNSGLSNGSSPSTLPVWLDWVLYNTQSGLVLLDADMRIVFANKWFLLRARLLAEQVNGGALLDVFPVLKGGHFERALVKAMRSGFPALMSQTLHPSPFPLCAPAGPRVNDSLLRQSIHIVPMGPTDVAAAGQRYTLIQITDVSPTVARERLLKAHADRMSDLVHIDALMEIGNRRFFDESIAVRVATQQQAPGRRCVPPAAAVRSWGWSCWILTASSSSMISTAIPRETVVYRRWPMCSSRYAAGRAIWWHVMVAKSWW